MAIRAPFVIAGWLACGIVAGGFLNAWDRGDDLAGGGSYALFQSPGKARAFQAFSIGMGLLFGPFALVITPFVTGFYQYGWSLDNTAFPCKGNPNVWCH